MRGSVWGAFLLVAGLAVGCAGAPSPAPPVGEGSVTAPPPAVSTPTPTPTPTLPPGLTRADVEAGLLSRDVPQGGTGALVPVPGAVPAPGPGRVRTVRVEVEEGVPVDGARFAAFVLAVLNDPRSWGAGGTMSFARTDSAAAEIRLILATPDTSRRMCRPLETYGRLSCRTGDRVVLTHYRWVNATEEYASDPTAYRQYVVNHEVGHALGHGHQRCPGAGRPAPVMQQQTLGLDGCAPNGWPNP
ncbi:DUF3152 domain-containing protein [Pseudonocardia sp. WMMC193]|uniref:DUF3152 domain-containing protein n=1 Tax=Pseudonocardia sp. WMMC193 TaxID=2911965 RepID=UPI001F316D68|nr:DUF3152 domain-containing protein [Pseudonocardia sp. WMMC193]MCF7548709.1 DUF3152 domain-containing protein [Pseudonocardia sp. WMMC193]